MTDKVKKVETIRIGFDFKKLRTVFEVEREDSEWVEYKPSVVALEISWWASKGRPEYFRTLEFSFGDWPGWTGIRFRLYRLELGFGRWKA